MFGLKFMKAPPTTYILHYKAGTVQKQGAGLSFFYFGPTSTIVGVPIGSRDQHFVYTEVTADFQEITIQGRLTYRITQPDRVAGMLDYRVDARGNLISDDPELLGQRLVNSAQILTRSLTQSMTLKAALVSSDAIVTSVRAGLANAEAITRMGVEVLDMSIATIRPTPEMAKALEAEAREELQRRADEAIYARRNAAVLEERKIKESELSTELAVEGKKRQIRESKIAADISVENERTKLIGTKVANERQESDSRAYALAATLEPLKSVDWRTLMAASSGGASSGLMISMAFRELAEKAEKIGQLNISPELLASLIKS